MIRATRAIPGLPTPPGFRRVAGNWVPMLSRRVAGHGGRKYASGRAAQASVVVIGGGGGGAVTVTSVTEATAYVGGDITINGTGFTAGQTVTVGGVSVASPTFDSSIQITAAVPSGCSYGQMPVVVAGVTLADAFLMTYEAEPTDPGSGYIWSDDLDGYANYAAISTSETSPIRLIRYETQPTADLITPGRGGSGNAIQCNYPSSGSQTTVKWVAGVDRSPYTPQVSSLVVQCYFRSTGSLGSEGIKGMMLWDSVLGTLNRCQFGVITSEGWHIQPSTTGARLAQQPIGPYWADVNDDVWHRLTVLYQPDSTGYPSATGDGLAKIWIDGIQVVNLSAATAGVTPDQGTKVWCSSAELDDMALHWVDYLEWPGVMTSLNNALTIDFDDLKWWQI